MDINSLERFKRVQLNVTIEEFYMYGTDNGEFIYYEYYPAMNDLVESKNHLYKINSVEGERYSFESGGFGPSKRLHPDDKLPLFQFTEVSIIYYRKIDAIVDLLSRINKKFDIVSNLLNK